MRTRLKDFFIPHEGNSYAPHSLQRVSMAGLVALALISFAVTSIYSMVWTNSEWLTSTVLPVAIVELTNDERVGYDVPLLVRNTKLDQAATLKAAHMAQYEYFSHYSPDGVSPWYWFDSIGYDYLHAGENIAVLFTDSKDVVDAWMDSPLHKENIVNTSYQEIGVGTAPGIYKGKETVYIVQLFGTRVPDNIAPEALARAARVVATTDPELVTTDTVAGAETERASTPEPEAQQVADERETQATEHLSTSSPIAAVIPADAVLSGEAQMVEDGMSFTAATQPNTVLQTLYLLIGIFVALCLVLSIFIEFKHQQPMQVAYSIGLLALLGGLFYAHTLLTSAPIIS